MIGGRDVLIGLNLAFCAAAVSSSVKGECIHEHCAADFAEAVENREVDVFKMELLQRKLAESLPAGKQNEQRNETGTESRSDAASRRDFSQYIMTFGRSYHSGTDEYERRHAVFQRNMHRIQAQNSMPTRIWSAGVNRLTDRTEEELKQLLGWRRAATGLAANGLAMLSDSSQHVKAPPEVVDWTHLQMAYEVPDQGLCGSCWAFATVSMLQARYEVQNNGTRTFSAQQLVNCVPNPDECGGSGGCDGATVELAMDYITKKGLQEEAAVPYAGTDGNCPNTLSLATIGDRAHDGVDFGLKAWHTLPENKALPLMNALADGPVAISVAANAWSLYQSGIFDQCGKNGIINHAVVLFGYGKDLSTGIKFWNVRNSWGNDWGENGFIRLLRRDSVDEEEYCGIDVRPQDGIACKPYPDTVRICGMCGILYDAVAASLGDL